MHKHEHSGSTRKTFGDPHKVLHAAGVREGDTVLDIGTGSGYLAVAAADIVKSQGKVYALDSFQQSIRALRQEVIDKNIHNVEALVSDAASAIPLAKGSIDVFLLSNVLHGFVANDEFQRVMEHILEAGKPDARVMVIDFKTAWYVFFGPPFSIRLAPGEVEKLFRPYGFTLIRQFSPRLSHYGLVFQKK